MKRWCVTLGMTALLLAPLHADITVVQTTTMEGAMAGAMGGAMPKITTRIKGNKGRFDIEMQGQTITSIADLTTKQVIMLDSAQKTATHVTGNPAKAAELSDALSKMKFEFKSTGQTKKIDGVDCDEHAFTLTINMADMIPAGTQQPPEAAEAMKDLRIIGKGSLWVAKSGPGVGEFVAFQKAALDANLLGAMMGGGGDGKGMEQLFNAAASAPGMPYLNEITMSFEGTGPIVEMMKQMGGMKMIQKTTSISTEALSDAIFAIPEGYTIEKK